MTETLSTSPVLNRVNLGDCIDVMQKLPSNSVQVVFADPPFNLNKKYASYKDDLPLGEYLDWTKAWITEACRVLKDDGSFFLYNIPRLLIHSTDILNEFAVFRHWISWNSNGKPLGKTLQPAHYGILYYTKNNDSKYYDVRTPHKRCRVCDQFLKDYGGKEHLRHVFGPLLSDVWDDIHRVRHSSKRINDHPCQLPIHLIERIILMSTDEGDVVLDPFCGGGSAAIASKQMGRQYIGVELDKEYRDAAAERYRFAAPVKFNDVYLSIHLSKIISIRDKDIGDWINDCEQTLVQGTLLRNGSVPVLS